MIRIFTIIFLALTLFVLGACGNASEDAHGHADAHGDEHADAHGNEHGEEAAQKGPHGGRLLEQADYAVELAIAETGTPPKYQAWLTKQGKPLAATAGSVEVHLTRLGEVKEVHVLKPREDGSLVADSIVGAPHSFDVEVRATINDTALRWTYESHEGRVEIDRGIADEAGIKVAPAGPGLIGAEHEAQGLVVPVEGRSAKVMARFPGPIKRLAADVGDRVVAGRVMAVVESNISLTDYNVPAPMSGVVVTRDASVGMTAGDGVVLYEIADLSSLWVDLHVFGADAQQIRSGARVQVTRMSDGKTLDTVVERLLPGTATASQSTVLRARIANEDGQWRPGAAVKARITVDQLEAPLVVPLTALQTFRDWDVVFVRVGDTYEVRPLQLGRRDRTQVEVKSGLEPGDQVVVEQSFLVKADIEKSGASHDH